MRLPAVLLTAVLLAGCGGAGGGTVDSSEFVCDDFAAYARDGQPRDQRSEVVSGMGRLIGNAAPALEEAHGALAQSVDGSESQWSSAADGFAQACFDNGWDG